MYNQVTLEDKEEILKVSNEGKSENKNKAGNVLTRTPR